MRLAPQPDPPVVASDEALALKLRDRDLAAGEDPAPPAGHRVEAAELDRRLHDAIAKLPEGQRQVLLMRYYGNLKFVEIARMLGCPLNTALGRMHKATIKLRQMMSE